MKICAYNYGFPHRHSDLIKLGSADALCGLRITIRLCCHQVISPRTSGTGVQLPSNCSYVLVSLHINVILLV